MTMKIEEGKYYITDAGEKVGPMVHLEYGRFPWGVEGYHYLWKNDGTPYKGDPEIIAEWTDDTAPTTDFAAISKRHGVKITVKTGGFIVEYDGRD